MLSLVLLGVLLIAIWRGEPTHPAPWCEATRENFRCHKPLGHTGEHWCDDLGGEFSWTSDVR